GSRRGSPAGRARRALRRGSPGRRLSVALLSIGFVLSLIAGRLVQLQGMDGTQFRNQAERLRLARVPLPAMRGSITSADGTILAMTVPDDIVTADPPQITGDTPAGTAALREKVARMLAGPLRMPASAILSLINHPSSRQYVVLARNVPASAGQHIRSLMAASGVAGIYLTPVYNRAYPNGGLASNLVGFTTTGHAGDLAGQAGIEQSYNSLLAGRDGTQDLETGTNGQPIPGTADRVDPMVPGRGVRLTILSGLQWEAQRACAQQVRRTRADSCTAVVMDPRTGRILALAQAPGYNPSSVTSLRRTADLPVSAVFPPGSTAKVITAAAALERGGQTPMSPYSVPQQIVVDGFSFHDADPHPAERLTLAGVLAHSSNVGMVQVAQHVSPQVQYDYYRNFGIGAPAGLRLPGASSGILAKPSAWWGDQRYTLAFGQGVAVTAVQMASVYATIANGGVRVQPSIVAGTSAPGGRFVPARPPARKRVLRESTARQLIAILQQVPHLDATLAAQPWGEIPGYSVAAKTGTAQVWDPENHCLCQYGSSYIGMAPASHPRLVVAVNVQHPRRGSYFGNAVAGPVFYHVMKFALQALKIPPDGAKRPDVRLTAP
ncbi:MAG: penicillin-binding protein 2, partial [Actinobacteria bacterium]|nr:penicillin-binding protein 2 [Actinomycetota bacterium]